jgi:hypothetical protein
MSAGQLVIVYEASPASTFVLDELVGAARQAGAKLLLAGDWAQLGSIDAGGAFSLLVKDRRDLVPQLNDVRRFVASWERDATLGLRTGDDAVIDAYEANGRITGADRTAMIAAVYDAWRADVAAGKSSLMIGADCARHLVLQDQGPAPHRGHPILGGSLVRRGGAAAGGAQDRGQPPRRDRCHDVPPTGRRHLRRDLGRLAGPLGDCGSSPRGPSGA